MEYLEHVLQILFLLCDLPTFNEFSLFLFSCFISDVRVLIGAFLVPIVAVMFFNLAMSVAAIRIILKQNKKKYIQGGGKHLKVLVLKSIIGITWLIVLFGLGWLFGLLTIREASTAFKYLFVIFNGFQGLYFFIFTCLLQKEARDFWVKMLTFGLSRIKKPKSSCKKENFNSAGKYIKGPHAKGLYTTPKIAKTQMVDYLLRSNTTESQGADTFLSIDGTPVANTSLSIEESSLSPDIGVMGGAAMNSMDVELSTVHENMNTSGDNIGESLVKESHGTQPCESQIDIKFQNFVDLNASSTYGNNNMTKDKNTQFDIPMSIIANETIVNMTDKATLSDTSQISDDDEIFPAPLQRYKQQRTTSMSSQASSAVEIQISSEDGAFEKIECMDMSMSFKDPIFENTY